MGKLSLAVIILFAGAATLARPWIGICSYYLLAILGPQYIWWWNFEGLRVSLIVASCTLLGLVFQSGKKKYDILFLSNSLNFWMVVLWFFIVASYFLGPYVDLFHSSGLRPSQIFSITNTIFFFYFCSSFEINKVYKIRFLSIIFAASTIYLTYWANNQYLSQNWYQFNMGRLMGPYDIYGSSIYKDENTFAMFFVTGLPFVYYLGFGLSKKWQRITLWLVIPLSWHAIFLTGSRGGLVGLGVIMLCIAFLSNRKILAIPLLLLFLVFYQWQAGTEMKTRSERIANYEGEGSAEMRIAAWTGGLRMILDHPILGVGLGSFATALPDYYDTNPRVAHNTFIQFAAESGIMAGIAYIVIVCLFFLQFRKIRIWCHNHGGDHESRQIELYNNASFVSFLGLVVCSLFLSLNTYETFFVLLIFNNALFTICSKKMTLICKYA